MHTDLDKIYQDGYTEWRFRSSAGDGRETPKLLIDEEIAVPIL